MNNILLSPILWLNACFALFLIKNNFLQVMERKRKAIQTHKSYFQQLEVMIIKD